MFFLLETIRLGLTNLRLHLMRSILTALGIIFGVAAVITMVAIGEGAKQETLRQIERLGAKNIIIRSEKPAENAQQQGGQQRSWINKFGLTREDLDVIRANFPDAEAIVPLKEVGGEMLRADRKQTSQAFGTTPELQDVIGIRVAHGRYLTQSDVDERAMVAVIGHQTARELFPWDDPLGNVFRIDDKAFTIVGVLEQVGLAAGKGAMLIGRDLNRDVHIPITTARTVFSDVVLRRQSGSFEGREVQVSEIIMAVRTREAVIDESKRLKRILDVRHADKPDVSMHVPFVLLEEARKTARTYQIMLAAIAGISLLVGGIGIMNIMLATVTERTREIGIRRAMGATRRHIIDQFLVETGVLSCIGGLIGVGAGVLFSVFVGWVVPRLYQIPVLGGFFEMEAAAPTQVTSWSIVVAFVVAATTGLLFGLYPAFKAAKQDPIVALRHD